MGNYSLCDTYRYYILLYRWGCETSWSTDSKLTKRECKVLPIYNVIYNIYS